MQKTLGGDRLGSGKKMKVELHNYERSTHDLGYVWRSTMSAGTLVPFLSEVALPGDTFDISLGCDVKTHPTIGPLFGSYKVQLDVFLAPVRLYHSALHNNALGIGRNMSAVLLPQIEMTATKLTAAQRATITDLDNSQINPSALLSYLGIRGVGIQVNGSDGTDETRNFNAIPILAYHEIYKNYYANKQEEIGAVIHTPAIAIVNTVTSIKVGSTTVGTFGTIGTAGVIANPGDVLQILFTGTTPLLDQIIWDTVEAGPVQATFLSNNWTVVSAGVYQGTLTRATPITINYGRYISVGDQNNGEPSVVTFNLSEIDDMRTAILASSPTAQFEITTGGLEPYVWLNEQPNGRANTLSSQEGLLLKTYNSDLFNNWLKTENIAAISTATAIDTSGGSFTIDQLILSKKVYNMLNRINVSGGSYDDWLDAVYMNDRITKVESPMYMGGLIKELVFQEVVSNSESTSGQPLGTLAGKGTMASKHKGGTVVIKVDEPSYIIGIVSLTPRIDYSQGNKWDTGLQTMDDFHKPALDEIGFQELITEQMAWWETFYNGTIWEQRSAGKQPAWINYMTNVNQVRGNFAVTDNEMFMTLNRRFENNGAAYPDPYSIADLTTYIDPSKYNFIFAETALDAQNFWTQIGVNITARRKMSAKIMPNL